MTNEVSTITGASPAGPVLFEEVQRFRQMYFWLPVVLIAGLVWWRFVDEMLAGQGEGSQVLPAWGIWVLVILFGVIYPIFAVILRLVTEVRAGELMVRLYPFRGRRIPLDTVVEAKARDYSPKKEYGGWGVRVGRSGRAYNAYGTRGVQLVLKDQGRILVGSQRADELVNSLRLAGAKVD